MPSLEEQIRALQSENESLTAAAEVVAAVTEEYAADASRWRKTVQKLDGLTDIVGAFNELSDASRRKDRRIERMTVELTQLRAKLTAKSKQNDTLNALGVVSSQIEQTLRDQIALLQGPSHPERCLNPASLDARCEKCGTLLECVDSMLRPLAKSEAALLRLRSITRVFFYVQRTTEECAGATIAVSKFPLQDKQMVVEALEYAKMRAEKMQAWAMTLPESANANLEKVLNAVVRIERQVGLLRQTLRSNDSPRTMPQNVTKMQCDLLYRAANSLMHTLPHVYRSTEKNTKSLVLENAISDLMSQYLANSTVDVSIQASDSAVENAVNQAQIFKTRLEKREQELDDAQVRVKVFEERLAIALHAKTEADNLRTALEQREGEIAALRNELSQAALRLAAMDSSVAQKQTNPAKQSCATGVSVTETRRTLLDATILDHALDDHKQRLLETRAELVSHLLADLRSHESKAQELHHLANVRSSIRGGSLLCKRSAASSQVVRLDPKTLRPLLNGTSLSKSSLISSATLARRELETLYATKVPRPICQSFKLQNATVQESIASFSGVSRALNMIS